MENIVLYQRPGHSEPEICKQITTVIKSLSEWFTKDVEEEVAKDLFFHDVFFYVHENTVMSYLIFTSFEGSILISNMGTNKDFRNKGYGTKLIQTLTTYAYENNFDKIRLFTVPSDHNPMYKSTINFYYKNGFVINKLINGLWESGAVLLEKCI